VKIIRVVFQTIGVLATVLCLAGAVWFIYIFNTIDQDKTNLSSQDAIFVLNWGGIVTEQDWSVIKGLQGQRGFQGDYTDFYCIQLEAFSFQDPSYEKEWHLGPEQNSLFADAVKAAVTRVKEQPNSECFPNPEVANSADMKISIEKVGFSGYNVTAAEIIFYSEKKMQLYYVGFSY
jgi:hypothetical protein